MATIPRADAALVDAEAQALLCDAVEDGRAGAAEAMLRQACYTLCVNELCETSCGTRETPLMVAAGGARPIDPARVFRKRRGACRVAFYSNQRAADAPSPVLSTDSLGLPALDLRPSSNDC